MNIKYKDLIHVLLPFIAQWADSTTRQGICLIIVLSQQLIIRMKLLLLLLQFWSRSRMLLNVVHGQVKKKTNKNTTKKSVGLRSHSTLITMFKCFFKWISSTRIWSKWLLPFIAQWADSATRQGICLIIVLSQQFWSRSRNRKGSKQCPIHPNAFNLT